MCIYKGNIIFLSQNNKIKLLIQALLLLALVYGLLFSFPAFASVGKVIYGYGSNYALDIDGNRRNMEKGSAVEEGDTLVTGAGRMQVRLIDGGLISVYPNSEYKIERFKFGSTANSIAASVVVSGVERNTEANTEINTKDRADASLIELKESKTDRGFFNLLKGAARQVTGVLGRKHNGNFKFKTTIATVGIRGTGFFARICQADCFDEKGNPLQDGMYVKNNVGVITMENNAGDIALAQGQAAFAASSEDAPVQTDESPAASSGGSDEIETFDFDGSVFQGNDGIKPEIINVKNLDYAFSENTGIGAASVGSLDLADDETSALLNGDEITHFEDNAAIPAIVFDRSSATLEESGIDTELGVIWNRWNGDYSFTKDGVAITPVDPNIHIIAAEQLTQDITSLTLKGEVNYTGTGGSGPTLRIGGNTLTGTQEVYAQIDFAGGSGVQVEQLNIIADFGVASADIYLTSLTSISSANATLNMSGFCNGCGAGSPVLQGFSTINVVGDNAQGVFGAYNLTGDGASISGSYVAAE